jgi:hypothetical protein
MLTVTYPRLAPERAAATRPTDTPRPVVAMALLAVVLLSLSWFERPRGFVTDQWYGMSTVEGVASYTPYRSEEDCRASNGDDGICLRGAELDR